MAKPVRITTRPDYFENHTESLEVWSTGSPTFPASDADAQQHQLDGKSLAGLPPAPSG
jgi:hypothetical protein